MTDERDKLVSQLKGAFRKLSAEMRREYNRHVSFGDLFSNRWDTAKEYGFGEGTSCYDNVLILGDVSVGKNCWIGPNSILDGSGGLKIGDNTVISAGAQVYTHSTVNQTVSMGREPIDYAPVVIGSGVYVGPNAVIQMDVTIGDRAVIGACSFVNKDIAENTRAWGCPAKAQTPR